MNNSITWNHEYHNVVFSETLFLCASQILWKWSASSAATVTFIIYWDSKHFVGTHPTIASSSSYVYFSCCCCFATKVSHNILRFFFSSFLFHGETNERTKRSVECKKPKRKNIFKTLRPSVKQVLALRSKNERMSAFKVRERDSNSKTQEIEGMRNTKDEKTNNEKKEKYKTAQNKSWRKGNSKREREEERKKKKIKITREISD